MPSPSDNTTIDVAAVIAELRQKLARPAQTPDQTAAVERQALQEALHEMELTRVISAHLPIVGHGLLGRGIALSQKIIRRLLRWYINPIVEQQNAFNDATLRTLHVLLETFDEHIQHYPPASPPRPPQHTPNDIDTIEAAQRVQKQQAHHEPPLSPLHAHMHTLDQARSRAAVVLSAWPLPVRSPIDHLSNTLHRLQRLGLRWYINPIVEQLNASNRATNLAVQALVAYVQARLMRPLIYDIQHHDQHG
jgi:hypothetical protein